MNLQTVPEDLSASHLQEKILYLADRLAAAERRATELEEQLSLQKAVINYSQFFELSPEAIFIQCNGCFAFANPAAVRLFGAKAPGDLLGKRVLDLIVPEDRASVAERIRILNEDRACVPKIEESILRLDGTPVKVEAVGTPIDLNNQHGALVILHDLTQRIEAEEALRRSEETAQRRLSELRSIYSTAPIGLCFYDTHFRYQAISDALAEINHLPANEHIGKTIWEVLSREIAEAVEPPLAHVLQTGEPVMGQEITSPIKDNPDRIGYWLVNYHPVRDENGLVIGASVVVRDVTERKESEQALWLSQQNLTRAQAVSRTGSWWLDVRRNELLWSDETHRMFGIPKGTPLTYEAFLAKVHPEDRDRVDQAWNAALAGALYNIEHRIIVGEQVKWVHEQAELELDPEGTLIGGFGTVQDVTEHRRVEDALRASEERLLRANQRLEKSNQELEQFAFMASHDLQEPLRKIDSFIANVMASAGHYLGEKELDYMRRAQNAANRMSQQIEDLLRFSRVTTRGKPFTQVDLNAVVRPVIDDLEIRLRQTGGRVEVGPLPVVIADEVQMHQLLQNLTGNALKFHRPDVPPVVKIGCRQTKPDWVEIFVEDNGIGFEMQHLEKIFLPFERLHGRSEFEGSGIGLAICKKIVERHGGEISAHSIPGKGSTFIISLPNKSLFD